MTGPHVGLSPLDLVHIEAHIGPAMDKPITIRAAKARLPELIRRAEAGEEVVIARGDKPVAKLVPIPPPATPKRQFGRYKGLVDLDDAFWEPLTDEELELWGLK